VGWGGTVTNTWRKLTFYTLKDDVRLSTLPTICAYVYLLTHGREDNCYSHVPKLPILITEPGTATFSFLKL
jgi:hypothetical protein